MNTTNSQSLTFTLDPMRAQAMHATLGHSGAAPGPGDPLPHFWHWAQFWDIAPPRELGRDGHPKLGRFIPDLGLPRRMWAGGALQFLAPLRIGAPATRRSEIIDIQHKTGRSGPLAFVTVSHSIHQDGTLCVTERQDLVYREDPDPKAAPAPTQMAPVDAEITRSHATTTTDLFRYSALTFNGHRIHYDLDYANDVEGYPGLVTHGPLLAQRLIELASQKLDTLTRFDFRAINPIFHFETFEACAKRAPDGLTLWVRGPDGRLAMTAQAT